jgi:hypothetical protein
MRPPDRIRSILPRLLATACVVLPATATADEPAAGRVILETGGYWRCHFTWKTIQLRRKSGELESVSVEWRDRGRAQVEKAGEIVRTSPPEENWTAGDFDDSHWARARGPLFTRGTRQIALICARGKFTVTDPAEAGALKLHLAYRGGAVVYVNGCEIARGHLPKGKTDPETPAEDYPEEAYLAPDGYLLRVGFGEPEKYADRFALRRRRLEAEVPASALRKGVNVLAVELHRAPVSEVFYVSRFRDSRNYFLWDMVGLEEVRLTARRGAGVAANVARPEGLQVWNHPVFVSVHNTDHGDPAEALRPIEIAAARNGAFSGQVVVGSREAIRGLAATAAKLTHPAGGAIGAEAVQVRYARPGDHSATHNENHRIRAGIPHERLRRRFDGLEETPPAEVPVDEKAGGAVQPIWLTVRVPRDARPGDYAGKLTLRADGTGPVDVPVRLHVADWTLPDPNDYRSHIGLIQSPDTLAIRYGAEMWSDAHWRLIDRSFALLGEVGCKVVYIPLLRRTYFGNEHSMVRWARQPDGSYGYDFGLVEKYLDTAIRHLGRVPVVCLYCWDVNTGSKYFGTREFAASAALPFTLIDPATGKLSEAVGPKWGRAAEFWKPLMQGMRRVLSVRGVGGSMMVGIAGDRQPNRDAVEDLKAAAPDAPWVCSSHSAPSDLFGQPVGYMSGVWGLQPAPDPAVRRYYGWKSPVRIVAFPRAGSSVVGVGMRHRSALGVYRIAVESALTARGRGEGLRGIGRCGADFWPVLPGVRGKRTVLGRYPETAAWHGGWLRNSTPYVLAGGAEGPVATARFEMLREGIQACEARIFLEEALTDPARRARLGEDLARRCQDVLDERVRANRRAIAGGGRYLTWTWFAGSGVLRRTRRLYTAAGEAAAALRAGGAG